MSSSSSNSGTSAAVVVLALIAGLLVGAGVAAIGGYLLFMRTAHAERELAEREAAEVAQQVMQNARANVAKAAPLMFDLTKKSTAETVEEAAKAFLADLRENRITKAYRQTTPAFQMKTDRKTFDEMVKKNPLTSAWPESSDKTTPPKAASDGKSYKYFCTIKLTASSWLDFALTLKEDEGEWKIEEIVVEKNE